ncbi:MAG TPA: hypothetical protein VJB94_05735 [Candidatus Nanoarchaeia archaeon]|nr:hypothetical protein [Candidatus Nanoarchaeia archaeon]
MNIKIPTKEELESFKYRKDYWGRIGKRTWIITDAVTLKTVLDTYPFNKEDFLRFIERDGNKIVFEEFNRNQTRAKGFAGPNKKPLSWTITVCRDIKFEEQVLTFAHEVMHAYYRTKYCGHWLNIAARDGIEDLIEDEAKLFYNKNKPFLENFVRDISSYLFPWPV